MTEETEGEDGRPSYDAIVLGAGITGLVSAAILHDQGAERVLVVDTYPTAGGNHQDRSIGPYTFDVGCFVFQDDSPLLRWFPELLEHYQPIDPSWARINPQDMVTAYPLSIRDDLLRAGPVELARIFFSLARHRLARRAPTNAKEFAEHWLGRRLVERCGLADYMERFCGAPLDRIDLAFAQQRMMWVSDNARVRPLLVKGFKRLTRRPAPNRQLARPRGGFAELYAPAVEKLEGLGTRFELGVPLDGVERIEGDFVVRFAGRSARAPRLVSTIPLDIAFGLLDEPPIDLPSVTLISLFYSFVGDRGFSRPILYNFTHRGSWKRMTVYSDFYGRAEGREYFTVEVVPLRSGYAEEDAHRDFCADARAAGLLDGDLRLEGTNALDHAYPIYVGGSAERAKAAGRRLTALGVESFGRQGGFRYQPTARASTVEAEEALRRPGGAP